MSTKNLARTAIEGGRCRHNKRERRCATRAERAAVRGWLFRVKTDPALAEALLPRRRDVVPPCFHDRLRPVERWLAKQAGRRWALVYRALRARHDARTTAGRHILFDHLLRDVAPSRRAVAARSWRREAMVIDDEGILRLAEGFFWMRRRKRVRREGILVSTHDLQEFTRGRKVGIRGTALFWFLPVIRLPDAPIRWRQSDRLAPAEEDFVRRLALDSWKAID